MDRAERTSLGVAVIGHLALFGVLSVGFSPNEALKLQPEAMEVTLSDEVALHSTSPTPDAEPPAAQSPDPAEMDTPDAPTPQPMPQVQPTPQPRVQPQPAKPQPAPQPQPKPKPAPAKPAPAAKPVKQAPAKQPAKQRGSLGDLTKGLSDKPRTATASTGAPASNIGPAQRSALASEIRRQLKPHWKAPTGADADQLRTELAISLAPNGSVTDIRFLRTTGVTDSNRAQMQLHRENAIKAVRLAAPFNLPPDLYDAWKTINPVSFDKRL